MWVTWKHERADFGLRLTYEQKVEVFFEQTLGWQLHIADLVANGGIALGEFKSGQHGYQVPKIRHSGFAVLHICLSYIELIGALVQSNRQSSIRTFEAGLRVIPGLIDPSAIDADLVERLYDGARCGLYHEGRTRPGVGLGQPPDGHAIAYDRRGKAIGISPERLPRILTAHLEEFRGELLDPSKSHLKQRFEERFDSGFAQPPSNKTLQPTSRARNVRTKSRQRPRAARG